MSIREISGCSRRLKRAPQAPWGCGWVWVAVCLAASALPARGQEAAISTNTVITADKLSFDYKRMIAVFEGDVVVKDPQVLIQCERLTVIFEGSNEVKSVTGVGNVRVWHADKRATCDQAIYLAKLGEVELRGNASLYRGQDVVSGNKITFWLNEERMLCDGRAQLVLIPTNRASGGDLLPAPRGRQRGGETRSPSP